MLALSISEKSRFVDVGNRLFDDITESSREQMRTFRYSQRATITVGLILGQAASTAILWVGAPTLDT